MQHKTSSKLTKYYWRTVIAMDMLNSMQIWNDMHQFILHNKLGKSPLLPNKMIDMWSQISPECSPSVIEIIVSDFPINYCQRISRECIGQVNDWCCFAVMLILSYDINTLLLWYLWPPILVTPNHIFVVLPKN